MKITLTWNGWLERWIIKKENGANIYEIPDCENVRSIFPDLNKGAVNIYELGSIIKTGEEDYG